MNYIEIPNTSDAIEKSVFLAGGITGCRDWRAAVIAQLTDSDLTVFNPLRPNFPIDDPSASIFQIQWEHEYLRKATAILFWFPAETLCPITLYELGAWSMTMKPLFVGVHPDYTRIADVELQTQLVRPDVNIVYSIQQLIAQLRHWDTKGGTSC